MAWRSLKPPNSTHLPNSRREQQRYMASMGAPFALLIVRRFARPAFSGPRHMTPLLSYIALSSVQASAHERGEARRIRFVFVLVGPPLMHFGISPLEVSSDRTFQRSYSSQSNIELAALGVYNSLEPRMRETTATTPSVGTKSHQIWRASHPRSWLLPPSCLSSLRNPRSGVNVSSHRHIYKRPTDSFLQVVESVGPVPRPASRVLSARKLMLTTRNVFPVYVTRTWLPC